jgi:septum formation protein
MSATLWRGGEPLVLASRSTARASLLTAAGIPIEIDPADIDERAVESRLRQFAPEGAALALAQEKAFAVAVRRPGQLVLGADQTLGLGDTRFDKPADLAEARTQLRAMSGRTHTLYSAAALVRDSEVLFAEVSMARLTMRTLSEEFLDAYFAAAGENATKSVGAYQLEALGVHLFEAIEGDHFTILGLPLLPLLAFLRRYGVVVA